MSGSLSVLLGTGPGAAGALLAYSSANGEGAGKHPDHGACTDLDDNHWKCATDTDGIEKTWKCTDLTWKRASWGCQIPAGVTREP